MRADRLLHIMLLLQTRGGMTTKELAGRLEVSERTVHRDMEALSASGVPVYADRGAAGGWRLTEGYRADWAGLRKDELLSLLASRPQRHLTDLGFGEAYEAAVLKLLAAVSPTQRRDAEYMRQRVYVDAAGWHPSGEDVPWLSVVQEAVWEGRKLKLGYVSRQSPSAPLSSATTAASVSPSTGAPAAEDSGGAAASPSVTTADQAPAEVAASPSARSAAEDPAGAAAWPTPAPAASLFEAPPAQASRPSASPATEELRLLNPLGLVLKGSLWYLIAARDGEEPRSYRVSRIRFAELTAEPAERPEGFDLEAFWQRSVSRFRSELPRYAARVLVHADACGKLEQTRFVRVLGWREPPEAGPWREAELEFHTLESACEIALGFGAKLRVLEPAELRSALQQQAAAIAAMYSPS
ncbi:helix-turn-helix transcriptional regulator [Paenibacillus chartarius]|uniref:Helix-turn-helix transcriptional regulator n=1 Tax=Paenibacillus chartarius TaxID=747481 RepID=A0ABV6DGE3_9BACL